MTEYSTSEKHQLDSLLKRVPFTSLTWIIGLMIGCGLMSLSGLGLLLALQLQGFVKEATVHGIIIFGFFAFAFWSLLPRRKEYLKKFEEMLGRTPILKLKYTDEEWDQWMHYVERIGFGQTRNTTPWKMLIMVILWGGAGGTLLHLMSENVSFVGALILFVGVMSLPLILYYLYWNKLHCDWENGPSDAAIFEDGVFFHHKFVDWKDAPDKGVFLWVERDNQPLATLSVKIQGDGAKLAPHLKELILPIPHDLLAEVTRLAPMLSQNIDYPNELLEESVIEEEHAENG